MELGLGLGDAAKPSDSTGKVIELLKGRSSNSSPSDNEAEDTEEVEEEGGGGGGGGDDHRLEISLKSSTARDEERDDHHCRQGGSVDLPVQLDLLPRTPVPRKGGCSGVAAGSSMDGGSSQTSGGSSSLQMDLGTGNGRRDRKSPSRTSDNDNDRIGTGRMKKLRLSKEQSAYLEESFKEHHTLSPKQKLALAKQLNLRPRQVEVWFQNRRARTKLKQMEVDCEYLKKCCDVLTEENGRLQKELQELRAMKSAAGSPFFMHMPATTLTMCPSCERVSPASAATSSTAAKPAVPPVGKPAAELFFLDRPEERD